MRDEISDFYRKILGIRLSDSRGSAGFGLSVWVLLTELSLSRMMETSSGRGLEITKSTTGSFVEKLQYDLRELDGMLVWEHVARVLHNLRLGVRDA